MKEKGILLLLIMNKHSFSHILLQASVPSPVSIDSKSLPIFSASLSLFSLELPPYTPPRPSLSVSPVTSELLLPLASSNYFSLGSSRPLPLLSCPLH